MFKLQNERVINDLDAICRSNGDINSFFLNDINCVTLANILTSEIVAHRYFTSDLPDTDTSTSSYGKSPQHSPANVAPANVATTSVTEQISPEGYVDPNLITVHPVTGKCW